MRSFAAAPILALAACSGGDRGSDNTTAFDVNAAAARAEGDIANYAAGTRAPVALAATPDRAPSTNSLPEGPIDAGGAQAAGDVVQHYYALIGARNYREAWALWRDAGRASGMSASAFAASFDRYADYHADVGAPGDVDAGAGQRYVTVPVRVYGTMTDGGGAFAMAGTVTLHRVAEGIDTSDPSDREWRIERADIKPRPAEAGEPGRLNPSPSPAPPDRPD